MMFESISKNKVKTFFIIVVFACFIAALVYFISLWLFEDSYIAIAIAFILALISSLISYFTCDKMVLSLNGARVATKEEFLQLNEILEGLCIAANLPLPKLYVIESNALNAFATGRNPKNSVICVTTALIEKLDKNEIEGVLAHELSHIKNYDIRLSAVVTVMVGFIVMLSDFVSRMLFWGGGSSDDNDSKGGNPILMIIGLICLILAPIFGNLMKLALSRRREYLADASAVELTRNPDGLISALEKISADPDELKTANKATANMYIVNPFKGERKKKQSNIWSTHPATEDRIEAIRNLK